MEEADQTTVLHQNGIINHLPLLIAVESIPHENLLSDEYRNYPYEWQQGL